ncbi:tRNA synthetase class I [Xylariomycetidae sp. FL0641]|nr:tRNA synthetase class I [Xylariomycetidae sp. FL0641]
MAFGTLLSSSQHARSTLCRVRFDRVVASSRQQTRSIGLKVLAKRDAALAAWEKRAEAIKKGETQNLWDTLKERGFVKDIAGTDKQIGELMRVKRIGAYVGIDPTAPSLHVGHLLPLMALFWMYIHGHRSVTVVGGSTAKIGDPTGRLTTREEMSRADRTMNTTKVHYQLKRIWANVDVHAKRFGYQREWSWGRALLNNTMWLHKVSFHEVAGRLFSITRVGPMLARDTVKRKMAEGDGMSLGELVYPLMQAWDFWHLFLKQGILMQIGGSDQYGNITAGIDAVKRLRDTEPAQENKRPSDFLHTPVGFTVPLLTDASGAKFGKSAGNAVWLDAFATTPYDFYGYFMRRPDADVEKLLKLLTFLPLSEIRQLMEQHEQDPRKRVPHHKLAYEVLALIHGEQEAAAAQRAHMLLHAQGGAASSDTPAVNAVEFYPPKNIPPDINMASKFRVDIKLPQSLILGKSISRILHAAGLAESISDANRLVAHQGASVGGMPGRAGALGKPMRDGEITYTPVKNWFVTDTARYLIDEKLLILRRGKHFVRVVEMVSDKEWEELGLSYPGEPYKGQLRMLRNALKSPEKNLTYSNTELEEIRDRIDQGVEDLLEQEESTDKPPTLKFPPKKPILKGAPFAPRELTPEEKEEAEIKAKVARRYVTDEIERQAAQHRERERKAAAKRERQAAVDALK